jgi:hypothetical protein
MNKIGFSQNILLPVQDRKMRIEKKYVFKRDELQHLLIDTKIICQNINTYKVTSIYFDNVHEQAYLQKIEGEKDKIKIRARYYNDSRNLINLEAKIKNSDKSYKLKTKLNERELSLLLKYNFIDMHNKYEQDDLSKIYFYYKYYGMQRSIDIEYKRMEMKLKNNKNVRITIDYDIFSSINKLVLTGMNKLRCVPHDLCVLEIKSNNSIVDSFLKFILEKYKMKNTAISKYALGVQMQKLNLGKKYGIN